MENKELSWRSPRMCLMLPWWNASRWWSLICIPSFCTWWKTSNRLEQRFELLCDCLWFDFAQEKKKKNFKETTRSKVPPLWEILNDPEELNQLLLFATSNNQQDDILFWCLVQRFRVEADPEARFKMGTYVMSSVSFEVCFSRSLCVFVDCFWSMWLPMPLAWFVWTRQRKPLV